MPGCSESPNRPTACGTAACGTAALGCASSGHATPEGGRATRPGADVPYRPALRPVRGGLFQEGEPMPAHREILDALPQNDAETDPKVDELCRTGPARHEGKMKVILLPTSASAPPHPAADTPCTPHPQGPAICVARPHGEGAGPAATRLNRPDPVPDSACRLNGSSVLRLFGLPAGRFHGATTPKPIRSCPKAVQKPSQTRTKLSELVRTGPLI